jgi:hypothetical protein
MGVYYVFSGNIWYGNKPYGPGKIFGGTFFHPEENLEIKYNLVADEGKYAIISIKDLKQILGVYNMREAIHENRVFCRDLEILQKK